MPDRGTSATGSSREPAPAIEVGGEPIDPGTRRRFQIAVARPPTETWLSLSVEVVDGRRRGPDLWLSAAVHGDEINGVEIIRQVQRGELVRRTMAVISDAFGDLPIKINAPFDCLVIGHTNNPLVNQGDALVHVTRLGAPGPAPHSPGRGAFP